MTANGKTSAKDERKLLEKHLSEAGVRNGRMEAELRQGWTIEDALRPEFWANVAHRFQKRPFTNVNELTGTIIELRTEDHAFFAELYVRGVLPKGLVVALMREPVYFGPKTAENDRFDIKWNVGKRGFDVIRKSDNEIVGDGQVLRTKEMAMAWINKTMAATG